MTIVGMFWLGFAVAAVVSFVKGYKHAAQERKEIQDRLDRYVG